VDEWILFDPAQVDLEPAPWRAELGEVLVQPRHPTAKVRAGLDEVDFPAHLCGLDRGGHPADTPADHQDTVVLSRHQFTSRPSRKGISGHLL
jgi:hypothetical protein